MDTWRSIRRAALGLVLCGLAGPLLAQSARTGGGGESQRIIQQYQQLAAEKSALEAQVTSLKHDLDGARAELGTVKKERDALKAHSAAAGASISEATAAREAAEKTAAQTKDRMNELVTHFRETATNLKQVETEREQLRGQLRERSAAYDQCAADNLSLYEINSDLLKRYENVGLFTRVSASEPFTRITRTRIDNLVDAYRARALELRAGGGSPDAANQAGGAPPPHP
ncbi:MAG TPA: hypothetical protein VMT09_04840 [Steroidobacteraceae bacterium]|nr:hypothetical protein [Steroidobacteraceae bacterium]